jgi:hypothetical protein
MKASNILWVGIKKVAGKRAPVGEPKPPDHRPYFMLRDGCPDLCCEQHRFYSHQTSAHRFPFDNPD